MNAKIERMQELANRLHAAENSTDAAIADTAMLVADMIAARQEFRVSATVDAQAHAKLAEAQAALSAARAAITEAHAEMNEVKLRLGVRTKMVGYEKRTGHYEQPALELVRNAS
jgi:hypothetical protein